MKRSTTILISVLVLILTVPWFFTHDSDKIVFGFPSWAFYSIAMTFGYAVLLVILIGVSWNNMEE